MQQTHAPVLRALQGDGTISVRACLDTNLSAAQMTAKILGASQHGSPGSVENFAAVDAVVIATPPESHASLALPYLQAGKHVFLEKPLAVRPEEADSLTDLARLRRARLLVNHIRRLYPSVGLVRRFVARGGIGRVRKVEATEGWRWIWATASEYPVKSPYGGVVYDIGTHILDSILFMLSLDDEASGANFSLSRLQRVPDGEPSHECSASLQLRNGHIDPIAVEVRLSRRQPLANVVKLYGEAGTLVVPTAFANEVLLYKQGMDFILREQVMTYQPTSTVGCFTMAHREFIRSMREPTYASPLEASSFSLLTGILLALTPSKGERP